MRRGSLDKLMISRGRHGAELCLESAFVMDDDVAKFEESTSLDLSPEKSSLHGWAGWILYSLSLSGALCSGVIYIFGIVSEVLLKSGYSPSQIDLIFGLGTFGQYFGLLPGFLADRVHVLITLLYGLLATVVGYGLFLPVLSDSVCTLPPPNGGIVPLVDFVVSRVLHFSSQPPLCLSEVPASPRSQLAAVIIGVGLFLIAQGSGAVHYATLPLLLRKSDPSNRGLISGTLAAGYGASAILLSALYGSAFHQQGDNRRPYILAFMFFIGVAMTATILLLMVRFIVVPEPLPFVEKDKVRSPKYSPTPTFKSLKSFDDEDAETSAGTGAKRRTVLSLELDRDIIDSEEIHQYHKSDFVRLALSPKFLLYGTAVSVMQGTCAATIGNVSLMRASREGVPGLWSLTQIVRFVSVGNFAGRIGAALVSRYVHTSNYHRFFVVTAISIVTAQILALAFPQVQAPFLVALILIATGLGANFAIGPPWVMQHLSVDLFSTLQSLIMCGVAASTFGLSMLTGHLYEKEGLLQRADDHLVCRGPSCFRVVHMLELFLNVFALILIGIVKKL